MLDIINLFDTVVIEFIQNNLHNSSMDKIMIFITKLADKGFIWILIGLGLLINRKYRKVGFMVLGAVMLGAIIGEGILKNIIQRDRPFISIEGIELLIKAPTTYSFPSGHTTSSFAAAGVIAINFKNKSSYIFILAILIGFSRIYLGVHFPTDIITGIILGICCSYVSILMGTNFKVFQNRALERK